MRNLGFVGLVSCLVLLVGCFSYDEVKLIKVNGISITEFSKNKIGLNVSLQLKNPNSYNIKVNSANLNISINNKRIGKLHLKNNLRIKKNSSEAYNLKFESKFENLDFTTIAVIISAITTKRTNIEVDGFVKGRVGILGRKFPIEFTEKIRF